MWTLPKATPGRKGGTQGGRHTRKSGSEWRKNPDFLERGVTQNLRGCLWKGGSHLCAPVCVLKVHEKRGCYGSREHWAWAEACPGDGPAQGGQAAPGQGGQGRPLSHWAHTEWPWAEGRTRLVGSTLHRPGALAGEAADNRTLKLPADGPVPG